MMGTAFMYHALIILALFLQPLLVAAPQVQARPTPLDAVSSCCGGTCCCEMGTCPCAAESPDPTSPVPAAPPTSRNVLATLGHPPLLPVAAFVDLGDHARAFDRFTKCISLVGCDAQPTLCLWLI